MIRFRSAFLLLLALAAGPFSGPASAQDSMRIAAVVNDDAISVLDVQERTNLIFATTGLSDTPETRQRILPQIMRTLIDEALQLQEAEREEIDLEAIDMEGAYRLVEQNLGLSAGQLPDFLRYNNLSQDSLDRQIKAEIVWNQLVVQRLRQDDVSEEDVDEEVLRIEATANEHAFLLAEIFLAVDDPGREAEVEANLLRLREAIATGASFPQLARQFSQSASAADGGDLGWIAESQLPEEWSAVVPTLLPGEVSQPLRVIGGYSLILMRESRQGLEVDQSDARLIMRQVIVPPVADESLEQRDVRVREVEALLTACGDFDALGQGRPDLLVSAAIEVRLGELQPLFQEAVAELAPEVLSEPVQTDQGMHLIMICERLEPESPLPTREEVRRSLENVQFDLISRGYLRDLRRAAFVDVRI